MKNNPVFFTSEQLENLEQTLQGKINLNPNDSVSYLELGKFYFQLHQILKAISSLQKAKALNPNLDQVLYLLGWLYKKTNRESDAVYEFVNLLKISPQYFDCAEFLGNYFEQKKDYIQALHYYKLALSFFPENLFLYQKIESIENLQGDQDENSSPESIS